MITSVASRAWVPLKTLRVSENNLPRCTDSEMTIVKRLWSEDEGQDLCVVAI
jgi:hypothetical protein